MRTQMQETSLQARSEILEEGKVGKQAELILAHVKPGMDYSRSELCRMTGISVNAMSGRVNDLMKAKRLEHGEPRKCRVTGRTVKPVRLPSGQMKLGLH